MSLFRLLPLTMLFAVCLLISKAVHVVDDTMRLSALFYSPASASEKKQDKKEKKKDEPKKEEEKKDDKKDNAKKEDDHGGGHGSDKEAKDDKKEDPSKPDLSKTSDRPNNQLGGLRPDDRRFSPIELDLLQQLTKRRDELDKREADILVHENLLTQTETRMDQKFAQMQTLKEELTKMLATYNEQEDAKVRGLVKIYETMKAKDAARIFDELEMPILLMVVDKMKEKNAAPVIAAMDSKKAKQLTVELAELRRIQSEKLKEKQALMPKPSAASNAPGAPIAPPAPAATPVTPLTPAAPAAATPPAATTPAAAPTSPSPVPAATTPPAVPSAPAAPTPAAAVTPPAEKTTETSAAPAAAEKPAEKPAEPAKAAEH